MIISLLVLLTIFIGVYYTHQAVKMVYDDWENIEHEHRVYLTIMFILWLTPWVMGLEFLIHELSPLVNK